LVSRLSISYGLLYKEAAFVDDFPSIRRTTTMTISTQKTGSGIASELSQEIQGKVILTTGVSPGSLGSQFVQTISKHQPQLLILAGRNPSKLEQVQAELGHKVETRILILDLSSQKQIRKAAEEVLSYREDIDILVNNAGIMASPYKKTEDGIEMQFGCNHISHFLFTNLIISKVKGRIINVSSNGYRLSPIRFRDINFQDGKVYNRWRSYGQSKTANMLFSRGLSKRGKTSMSIHPGVIKTNLSGDLDMSAFEELFKMDDHDGNPSDPNGFKYLNLDEGTATHIFAAFQPGLEKSNGVYLDECRVLPPQEVKSWARDDVEADMLWSLSEKLVGQSFN
jgi:NAD(P)-dependent dehydrogenase (short-subunit alcohol dehydrogenase family)